MIRFTKHGPEVYFEFDPHTGVHQRGEVSMSIETYLAIARVSISLEDLRAEIVMQSSHPETAMGKIRKRYVKRTEKSEERVEIEGTEKTVKLVESGLQTYAVNG